MNRFGFIFGLLLLAACSEEKPPPPPSETSIFVGLQEELADIVHGNQLDCDKMATAIDEWFKTKGEQYKALSAKAEAGQLKAKLGGGLMGRGNVARSKISTYVGSCAPKSEKLREVVTRNGL